jgi:hypothetical protein
LRIADAFLLNYFCNFVVEAFSYRIGLLKWQFFYVTTNPSILFAEKLANIVHFPQYLTLIGVFFDVDFIHKTNELKYILSQAVNRAHMKSTYKDLQAGQH